MVAFCVNVIQSIVKNQTFFCLYYPHKSAILVWRQRNIEPLSNMQSTSILVATVLWNVLTLSEMFKASLNLYMCCLKKLKSLLHWASSIFSSWKLSKRDMLPLNSLCCKAPQIYIHELHFRGKLTVNYLEHILNINSRPFPKIWNSCP